MSTQTIVPDKLKALLALANSGPAPQTTDPALTQIVPSVPIPRMPVQSMQRLAVPSTPDAVPSQLLTLRRLSIATPSPDTTNTALTATIPDVRAASFPPQTTNPTVFGVDAPKIPQAPMVPLSSPPPIANLSALPSPKPDLGAVAAPNVQLDPQVAATQARTLADQQRLAFLNNSGSGVQQITHPVDPNTGLPTGQKPSLLRRFGGVLARIGDTAESVVAPGVAALTPGTTLHHDLLLNQQAGRVNNDLADEQRQAQTNLLDATPELRQMAAENNFLRTQGLLQHYTDVGNHYQAQNQHYNDQSDMQALIHGYKPDGNGGYVPMSNNELSAQVRHALTTVKPEQRDDRAIRILATPPAQRTADDIAYLRGYNAWVQQTKVAPGVARAQTYAQWRPVQVVDPTTQNTYYVSAATAIDTHAPGTSSIPFRAAAGIARYMISGKGGAMMTAYRTGTDHLDLLGQAADALQNGDIPAFNRVANELAQETGEAAPTNFDAVKSMLSGELANVAKASGATDSEINSMRTQVSRADSPAQLRGIIDTNQDLMDQKAQEMFEQYQAGMQGVPVMTRGGMNPARRTPLATHGGNSGTAVSLAAAMSLPINKGKSEAQVRTDIQTHGHQVIP